MYGEVLKAHGCGKADCRCSHLDPCDKGFIQTGENSVNFCPICDRERHLIVKNAKSGEQQAEQLRARKSQVPTEYRVI